MRIMSFNAENIMNLSRFCVETKENNFDIFFVNCLKPIFHYRIDNIVYYFFILAIVLPICVFLLRKKSSTKYGYIDVYLPKILEIPPTRNLTETDGNPDHIYSICFVRH